MNFPLIMLMLLLVTGGIWLLDHFILRRKRAPDTREPWWIEYPKSFFPVILIVFALRSFLLEPFKIPSGSMIPTLLVGDFILVNKYTYGVRLPVINLKVMDVNEPKRGEVMVFRYPENPSLDYIKRIVGLPGDTITYRDKQLILNGNPLKMESVGEYIYIESRLSYVYNQRYVESLGEHGHNIIINPEVPGLHPSEVHQFPFQENCIYQYSEFTCTVPAGNYFTMGDNRDSSSDSRYWGFVPERNIVGKAFLIWWNFSDFKRIGLAIE
ncbi:MAG: signal peptidase I [Nitrosomonadaceae bacterium]|nr:signal peptidase I [Nitrosospira sp.]MDW7565367.1 signal peptidase I [Nitrosomonadaceae bacterium]MBI0409213.1 signal peptidase I [Nitrosospira sp.]MBI0410490.1 signal peptidase I [Nitrosospira sp.]MBI0412173.1 signal peptidase I [Nitrosospira sp.]